MTAPGAVSDILVDSPAEGVCRLTLNRPDALNAFTFDMYLRLIAELEVLKFDARTRVVVLTGAGRGFCSGHDLKNSGPMSWVDPEAGRMQRSKFGLAKLGQIPVLLGQLPQVVICAVNGVAAGLGYTLALASDMALMARSAKFINTFHNAATGHELGLSYLLPRAIGMQRAAELLYTSRPVLADEAERIGLVLRAVDDGMLVAASLELAASVAANVPLGVALTKQSLRFNLGAGSLEAAIEFENRAVMIAQATEDAAEKRRAFFEKRPPVFRQA